MTTSLAPTPAPRTFGRDTSAFDLAPIPFARLVRVEWAKATDTRAARCLLALVVLVTVGTVLVPVLAPSAVDQSLAGYLRVTAIGMTIPLPVVAILLFTGEWSHGSVITTFTQEPRRLRVLNAKLAVSLFLGVAAAVVGLMMVAAGLGLAAASGRSVEANASVGVVLGFVLFVLLNVLAGVALGALLQNSAAAIAASFALPALVAVVGTASSMVANWLDMSTSWNSILVNDWSGHLPQIAVSVTFWIVAPLTAGIVRTLRRDIG